MINMVFTDNCIQRGFLSYHQKIYIFIFVDTISDLVFPFFYFIKILLPQGFYGSCIMPHILCDNIAILICVTMLAVIHGYFDAMARNSCSGNCILALCDEGRELCFLYFWLLQCYAWILCYCATELFLYQLHMGMMWTLCGDNKELYIVLYLIATAS